MEGDESTLPPLEFVDPSAFSVPGAYIPDPCAFKPGKDDTLDGDDTVLKVRVPLITLREFEQPHRTHVPMREFECFTRQNMLCAMHIPSAQYPFGVCTVQLSAVETLFLQMTGVIRVCVTSAVSAAPPEAIPASLLLPRLRLTTTDFPVLFAAYCHYRRKGWYVFVQSSHSYPIAWHSSCQ